MPSFARSETTNFLIRLLPRRSSRVDQGELQRLLQYLGGVQTRAGYAFPDSHRRQEAWEVLGERYGSRYFEKYDQLIAVDPT